MIEYGDLIGKPYEVGARGPEAYDCYGLYMEINRRAGIVIPDLEEIVKHDASLVNENVEKYKGLFRKIVPEDIKLGDAVTFNTEPGLVGHIGVVMDKIIFLQVTSKHEIVHSVKFGHPFYQGRIEGFYRYEGS